MAPDTETGVVERITADDILAINDTETDVVYVHQWRTNVKVQGLTKRQQLDIRQRSMVNGEVDAEKSQQYMWLEGVVEPRFTEDQLGPLFEKSAGAIDLVLTRVLELSGMKPEDLKAKEAAFRQG